jgi:hypothetical protein
MGNYIVANGDEIEIKMGDWVDITPNLLPLDKTTGLSYEVCSLYENAVGIKVNLGENFLEVILSPIYISGNYRKV